MKFIVRVYGIYIDPEGGLLVSDEVIKGRAITKFPGGGLEYGEGTVECLKREMKEETGVHFEVLSHFYTTDYFVESVFDPGFQVISIYYKIKPLDDFSLEIFNSQKEGNGSSESFRFLPLAEISADKFTLTIDRHVASLLGADN